jgi:hypothetical protein
VAVVKVSIAYPPLSLNTHDFSIGAGSGSLIDKIFTVVDTAANSDALAPVTLNRTVKIPEVDEVFAESTNVAMDDECQEVFVNTAIEGIATTWLTATPLCEEVTIGVTTRVSLGAEDREYVNL